MFSLEARPEFPGPVYAGFAGLERSPPGFFAIFYPNPRRYSGKSGNGGGRGNSESSIIRPPVGSGVFVDPILLGVGHAFAPGDFPSGSWTVKGAAFRAVAEGFEPVLFL